MNRMITPMIAEKRASFEHEINKIAAGYKKARNAAKRQEKMLFSV
ncbi:hypothetical protein ABER99_06510 [Paenibacillus glucanolyticus]|jgi:hypothetical protein|nr:hypothetical protein [Paenibacillus glucanolyticus]